MLTADAFGVLPPIARLTPSQAMYHFLSGYTAKVAGTEKGVHRAAGDLLDLLRRAVHAAPSERLRQAAGREDRPARRRRAGWSIPAGRGGGYGVGSADADRGHARARCGGSGGPARRGSRCAATRSSASRCRPRCRAVDGRLLDPRETWADAAAYDAQATQLVAMFAKNFAKFEIHVDAEIRAAAPHAKAAAEV